MKKTYLKRTTSLLLALVGILSAAAVTGCQKDDPVPVPTGKALPPTGMKVALLSEPYGVDRDAVAFSWVMNDEKPNELQTAYRLTVTENGKTEALYDSGWVESAQSAGVRPDGLSGKLKDNSLYFWTVETKNKEGEESGPSAPQFFSTAVGKEWEDTRGIWASTETEIVPLSNDWTDYTVDVTFRITDVALGVIFRGEEKNFYMWQFRVDSGKASLCPHVYQNGSFVGGKQIASVAIPDEAAYVIGDTVTARITCEGNTVTTALKSGDTFVEVDRRDMKQYGLTEGVIGFRTGSSESGIVTEITAKTLSGEPLYLSNFNVVDPFSRCPKEEDGIRVPKALSNGCLIDREALKAQSGDTDKSVSSFVFLRQEFDLHADKLDRVERAVMSVTASSPDPARQYVFNLSLNGKLIGVGPARLSADKDGTATLPYESYDVTSSLTAGKNCVSAINYATGGKLFLCQMTLFYRDGTREILLNSARDAAQWKGMEGDGAFGLSNSTGTNYYTAHANNIDASLYPFGFDRVGYDDGAWKTAELCEKIDAEMQLVPSGEVPVLRFDAPTDAMTVTAQDGAYLIDLGCEIVGGLRLTVDLPEDAVLTLRYSETLTEDGTVRVPMISGNKYEETWKLVKGKNEIETVEMLCYRYVEISGCPVALTKDNVRGVEVRTAFDESASSFTSDSALLNDLYTLTKNTIKRTTQGLYVDSQSRERGAYEGDLIINLYSAFAFSDDYSVARFTDEYLCTHRTWPAEYILYTTMATELLYRMNGDLHTAEKYYSILKKNRFTDSKPDGYGLIGIPAKASSTTDSILVDWPTTERDGYDMSVAFNTVLNAISVRAEEALAGLAAALGKDSDAKAFSDDAAALKQAMIDRLWNEETGAFADGLTADGTPSAHFSQHATAYALACGIYDSAEMADRMAAFLDAQGEIRMSVFGVFFLFDGLYSSGHGDVANRLLLSENCEEGARTFAYMLRTLDATLTTEAWNEVNKKNMTYCHPWGSAPAFAIVNGIFGIRAVDPGFSSFEMRLSPTGLKNASLLVPTVKGSISASFDTASGLSLNLTVPANVTASVLLPGTGNEKVTLDGKQIDAVCADGFFTVAVGSGTHSLTLG